MAIVKYLVVSDMHGNWEAFRTVLRAVRRKRFDATLVLGDLVGYGAAPNQVVAACRNLPGTVYRVRGNHDKVVAGLEDGSDFNEVALTAARWTRTKLQPVNQRHVRELPRGPLFVEETVAMCHGAPIDEDLYLFASSDAQEAFEQFPAWLTFFGHTHLPSMFVLHEGEVKGILLTGERGRIQLRPEYRYLINPGSIGQPRDRDPRAAYMIYDSDRQIVHWYRRPYDIGHAQQRIAGAGLPVSLAERLAYGV